MPAALWAVMSILTLIGFVNVPIIKFSVDWWNTLHQPASVMRMGGSALDKSFLIPLLVMAVGLVAVALLARTNLGRGRG